MAKDLILLIGQSNMAGRGLLGEVPPIKNAHITMLRDDQWQQASEPLHTDKETAGVGLASSFASEYLGAFPEAEIGLVPSADGGTPLSRWMPGCDLYENALVNAHRAMEDGQLKAILWHQGEADAQDIALAQSYGQRLSEMVAALREALNAPAVPFISGGLGDFLADHATCVHYKTVNAALQNLSLSACGFASATGLEHLGDGIHFSSAALREFGRRYADQFLRINAAKDKK